MGYNSSTPSMKAIPWEVDSAKLTDAYVAGFLDGDGSIVATTDFRPERRRFPHRIRLKINFTQHVRHIKFLEALRRYLGGVGNIRVNKIRSLAELVILDRRQLKVTATRLLPHTVIKKRQVRALLSIIEIFEGATVKVRSSLSEKEYEDIVSLTREIRQLNSGTGGKQAIALFDPVTTQDIKSGVAAPRGS